MLSIDEAIAQERKIAKEQKTKYDKCLTRMRYCCEMCFNNPKCNEVAEYHEQITEWLEELKELRHVANELRNAGYKHGHSVGYNNAIDDFANTLKENYDYLPQILSQEVFGGYIDEYAEQLKAGGENES